MTNSEREALIHEQGCRQSLAAVTNLVHWQDNHFVTYETPEDLRDRFKVGDPVSMDGRQGIVRVITASMITIKYPPAEEISKRLPPDGGYEAVRSEPRPQDEIQ